MVSYCLANSSIGPIHSAWGGCEQGRDRNPHLSLRDRASRENEGKFNLHSEVTQKFQWVSAKLTDQVVQKDAGRTANCSHGIVRSADSIDHLAYRSLSVLLKNPYGPRYATVHRGEREGNGNVVDATRELPAYLAFSTIDRPTTYVLSWLISELPIRVCEGCGTDFLLDWVSTQGEIRVRSGSPL